MGGWYKERMKLKVFGSSILKICIIYIIRNRLQFTCVALMGFRAKVGKPKNGKAPGKDEITGEMIKGGGHRVVDWIWKLFNMVFESGVVPED